MVVVYLNDVMDVWLWSSGWLELSWQEFVGEFCACFGERAITDVVEEFNKLKHEGVVDDYLIRFEELKSLLTLSYPTLD